MDFAFNWVLLLFVGGGGIDFDVVFFEKCDYIGGVFGGAGIHAYFVDAVAVGVVKIDNVTDGFDESVARFVFCHNSVTKAGAQIFENKPAGEASN